MKNAKQIAATYARYSSDHQRSTSIADQQRRCVELAERHGVTIPPDLFYSDEALSGTAKHNSKRTGYQALLQAWRNGKFRFLILDEISRISRDVVELAKLQQLIEETGVRLITVNGIDSDIDNWQLQLGVQSIISQQTVRDTRHRVKRGLQGQLERGYMIAPPAFGYTYKKDLDENGNSRGTHWLIDKKKAKIVREMFAARKNGKSIYQIAKMLNDRNIPPPRPPRKTEGYWRGSTISKIFKNKIYRGVFELHGSECSRIAAKKKKQKLVTTEYERPELRIVEDDLWYEVNYKTFSRTGYGGGKHKFSGLITCSVCGCHLSISNTGSVPSLNCDNCCQARMSGIERKNLGYVSCTGIEKMLIDAISQLVTPVFKKAFQERLKQRLTDGSVQELTNLKTEHSAIYASCKRLASALASVGDDDDIILTEYKKAKRQLDVMEKKIEDLQTRNVQVNPAILEQQLAIDPASLIPRIFGPEVENEKARALLCRIFKEILFMDKPETYVSIFRVTIFNGVVAAILSDTNLLDTEPTVMTYQLTAGSKRPSVWEIKLLSISHGHQVALKEKQGG